MSRNEKKDDLSTLRHRRPDERITLVDESVGLSEESRSHLQGGGGLRVELAERMSENVLSTHGLPLSVVPGFRLNRCDVLVPMVTEERSVVAAAANAAKWVRAGGGFEGESSEPIMTAQLELEGVPEPERAASRLASARETVLQAGNSAIPGILDRGGGCRDLESRVLDSGTGLVVVHLYVHVGDAMGANLANAVAESAGPTVREALGGRLGMAIVSNLCLRRMTRVSAAVNVQELGGIEVADALVRASRFAQRDPFRAVTHNKGVMNGIDAVAVATGQDWRAIEAAAHGYAATRDGRYGPLAVWTRTQDGVHGTMELPLPVGTAGGVTDVHPGIRATLEMGGFEDARWLAVVVAAAGLATNLAALRALVTEGIRRGQRRLHQRNEQLETGD